VNQAGGGIEQKAFGPFCVLIVALGLPGVLAMRLHVPSAGLNLTSGKWFRRECSD
jgi:hypothetical protein